MATVPIISETRRAVMQVGERTAHVINAVGDWSLFAGQTLSWIFRRRPSRGTLVNSCYAVGVRSVGVITITGLFIGMVLAVQTFSQLRSLQTRLGAIINVSVVRELGPVLAATMIAGRVGSAMAAELASMRISEQIDALSCLGANPIHYLVVPRFLACMLLIPLLTVIADFMGVMGGAVIGLRVYHIDAYNYWAHSNVSLWDLSTGLIKSAFFGGAIALTSCQRGFKSGPGSEGVGRAATEAFVASFIIILGIDFFLALFLNTLYGQLWPL